MARYLLSLFLLGVALSLPAGGTVPPQADPAGEAWVRMEERFQRAGASDSSRTHLYTHPGSLALSWQFARAQLARRGPAGVRKRLTTLLETELLKPHAALHRGVWDAAVALDTGEVASALAALAQLPLPAEHTWDRFTYDLLAVRANLGAGRGHQADSIAAVLAASPEARESNLGSPLLELELRDLRARVAQSSSAADSAVAVRAALARQAARLGYRVLSARIHFDLGRHYIRVGRADSADVHLARVEALTTRPPAHPRLRALAQSWRGYALELLGRAQESYRNRRSALVTLRRQGDSLGAAYALLGIGWVAYQCGEPDRAMAASREAAQIFEEHNVTPGRLQALHNLALVASNTGLLDDAKETWGTALELARTLGDTERQAQVLNSLGILAWREQRPDRAVAIYEDLLSLHRSQGNLAGEQQVLNNLALANESMGRLEQAKVLYRRCIALESQGVPFMDSPRINLARLLAADDEYAEADSLIVGTLAALEGETRYFDEAHARQVWGRVLQATGRLEQAVDELRRCDALLVRVGNRQDRLEGLLRLGDVLRELGRHQESLDVLEQAGSVARALHDRGAEAAVRGNQAVTRLAAGDTARAREAVSQSADLWREALASGLGADRVTGALSRMKGVLTLLNSRPPSGNATVTEQAFDLLQDIKALTLFDYVEPERVGIRPDLPDSLLEREERSRVRVERLRKALAEEDSPSPRLPSALAEAEASFQAARRAILNQDRRYRTAGTVRPVTGREVLGALDDGTVILDYMVGPASGPRPIVLFALDDEGLSAHRLGSYRELKGRVDVYVDLLRTPPRESESTEALDQVGEKLARALLGPVAERVRGADQVVIAADGFLHQLPFAALPLPGGDERMVEAATLVTPPSLTAWIRRGEGEDSPPSEPSSPRWDLALWQGSGGGGSGAAGDRETRELSRAFRHSRVFSLEGSAGVVDGLRNSGVLTSSRVIHFVAHGFFDPAQPWRSGVYLSDSERLAVADVYHLDMNCDLVALSACETARGDLNSGWGIQGFTEALLGSGARAVLATLWSIDDANAPAFMKDFYGELAAGQPLARALREAQLAFLGDPERSHPFYWAPFVVMGDVDRTVPLEVAPWWKRGEILLVAASLLLFAAGLYLWRRG